MNHLAKIQVEFLKVARNWDDMTVDEQWSYLRSHPSSKRRLTAKPKQKSTKIELTPAQKASEKDITSRGYYPVSSMNEAEPEYAIGTGDNVKWVKILRNGKVVPWDKKSDDEVKQKVKKMIESGQEDTDSYERLLEEELAKELGNNGEPIEPEINEDDPRIPR